MTSCNLNWNCDLNLNYRTAAVAAASYHRTRACSWRHVHVVHVHCDIHAVVNHYSRDAIAMTGDSRRCVGAMGSGSHSCSCLYADAHSCCRDENTGVLMMMMTTMTGLAGHGHLFCCSRVNDS